MWPRGHACGRVGLVLGDGLAWVFGLHERHTVQVLPRA